MSVSNITSSSQSNFNHSSQQQPQLPLSEPPTEDEYVVVKFDYDHKPKEGRKGQPYTIKKGEKLRLIERTNAEWWKVKSKGSIFVFICRIRFYKFTFQLIIINLINLC